MIYKIKKYSKKKQTIAVATNFIWKVNDALIEKKTPIKLCSLNQLIGDNERSGTEIQTRTWKRLRLYASLCPATTSGETLMTQRSVINLTAASS